jgi:cell wall-associated NlpC family hydrolase
LTSFFTEFLADAQKASAATHVLPSVILAQWAIETGGGTSPAFVQGNNYAGVSYAGVTYFPTRQAGLNAYIATLNLSYYAAVRSAQGSTAQAIALGASVWAGDHYDEADWIAAGRPADGAWTPPHPGIDLTAEILNNNLTQYDGAQASNIAPNSASATKALAALPTIPTPPLGLSSDVVVGNFAINGQSFDLVVSGAIVTAQLDLSMTTASTFTLTLHDPDRVILNSGLFSEKAVVNFGSTALSFSLVSVNKQGTVLTVTFEAYVVAALRTATGAITTAAGQMTRTDFARYLVTQVQGAGFNCPPPAWLYSQDDGYDSPTQEQISRGTSDAPLEDSWTCLQRLAAEVDWVCFEDLGVVYFGPENYLAAQPPVMVPVIGQGGIEDIDGEYDIGDTSAQLTITARADTWFGQIGNAVLLQDLGPLNGTWLISEIEREDVEEPELTITIVQPQPNLPEPASGGAQAAVGAGFANGGAQQTQGGALAAQKALAFAEAQIGKPYISGGTGPAGYDCSGLVQTAYGQVGISIPRTTTEQWGDPSIAHVPAGIANLLPGDLVYFDGGDTPFPGHVAMVVNVDKGTNDVIMVDAYSDQVPLAQQIRYDHFGYVNPGSTTAFGGKYWGAIRPSP